MLKTTINTVIAICIKITKYIRKPGEVGINILYERWMNTMQIFFHHAQ